MPERAPKIATYDDVLAAPEHVIVEVLAGVLHTQPRPALLHSQAASALGAELVTAFQRGKGGPGGWIVLDKPEIHLGTTPDILVPHLGGWRRSTLPAVPDAAYTTVRPDWVCEVLSPSTRGRDRVIKMKIYARERVPFLWMVDPDAQTLEVFRLDGEVYRWVQSHAGDERVRVEPFEAVELELAALWMR